jgi:hypothetical protein
MVSKPPSIESRIQQPLEISMPPTIQEPSLCNSSIILCKAIQLPDVPFMLLGTSWEFKDVMSFSFFFFVFFLERRRCRCSSQRFFFPSPLFLRLESILEWENPIHRCLSISFVALLHHLLYREQHNLYIIHFRHRDAFSRLQNVSFLQKIDACSFFLTGG